MHTFRPERGGSLVYDIGSENHLHRHAAGGSTSVFNRSEEGFVTTIGQPNLELEKLGYVSHLRNVVMLSCVVLIFDPQVLSSALRSRNGSKFVIVYLYGL